MTDDPTETAAPTCPCGKPEDDPIHIDPATIFSEGAELPESLKYNHPFGSQAASPEMVDAVKELEERHTDLVRMNGRKERALAKGTPPMQLDNASKSALRFETILNIMMPPGSVDRLSFEVFYQESVAAALEEALSEQRRMSLTQNGPGSGGLIL